MQPDGPEIRRRRERCGYGLHRFAKVAQIHPAYLSRIERNERNPQPEVMARIAHGLGCGIADIQRDTTEHNDERHHR
ncbi:helix-turn-helix domain-containing protein [Streptomyces sp. NPDC094447]|uniref:helix-turn-helix domain-containing protein n=1 Tax=Streptomyces sp. NPDC094447 TaxID=3366062 RepID=UPI0037F5C2C5